MIRMGKCRIYSGVFDHNAPNIDLIKSRDCGTRVALEHDSFQTYR